MSNYLVNFQNIQIRNWYSFAFSFQLDVTVSIVALMVHTKLALLPYRLFIFQHFRIFLNFSTGLHYVNRDLRNKSYNIRL